IRTDVELDVGATDLGLREPDVGTLRDLYERYGFVQALKDLDGGGASGVVPARATIARPGSGYVAPAPTAAAAALDPALAARGRPVRAGYRDRFARRPARQPGGDQCLLRAWPRRLSPPGP